jgi:hypothetical protein
VDSYQEGFVAESFRALEVRLVLASASGQIRIYATAFIERAVLCHRASMCSITSTLSTCGVTIVLVSFIAAIASS